MWVRSKYTSELAVLSAWLSVLIPWNVAFHTETRLPLDLDSDIYFFRFAFFELQLRQPVAFPEAELVDFRYEGTGPLIEQLHPGSELIWDIYITTPLTSADFYDGTLQTASYVWLVAAIAFGLAFLLSLALYFRTEATLERLPVSEVRLMGALLGLASIGTAVATVLQYQENDVVGTPIPVGVFVVGTLAAVLLRTEEVSDDESTDSEAHGDPEDSAENADAGD